MKRTSLLGGANYNVWAPHYPTIVGPFPALVHITGVRRSSSSVIVADDALLHFNDSNNIMMPSNPYAQTIIAAMDNDYWNMRRLK
mmetsp:Transcript_1173/g.1033  ORF Transcript_1173/g.1033 Transcript_1173/m.1033 type:complete len:85 (+) Transcript_1173:57-311(+)